MSLQTADPFALSEFPVEQIDSGTSMLLTGDDSEVLAETFARIVAPDGGEDEQTVLLGTTDVDTVVREMKSTRRHSGGRTHVITESEQRVPRVSVESTVDDIGDMTQLGMQTSDAVGEITADGDRFRAGIFLCSDMCRSVDDIRSVYRFLNTSFLSELRRNTAVGACAVETDAGIETDVDSMIRSMSSSFDAHLRLTDAGLRSATFDVDGLPSAPAELTVSL